MTKEIKEFLPLYLGQKVKVSKGLTEAPECYLRGHYTVDKDGFNVERYQIFTEPGNNIHWLEESEFKLILRHLSSITGEEAGELFRIVHPTKTFFPDTKYDPKTRIWKRTTKVPFGHVYELDVEWLKATQFIYLLSKGFDLFGLIESGLALDSKTLKN